MNTPATIASKVLSNKWTWIIIVVVIILLVLNKNGKRWLQLLQNRDRGNYAGQEAVPSNPARQAELDQYTRDLFAAIDGLPSWNDTRPELFERALGMNDTELRYVAKFYPQLSDGRSLSDDVAGEYVIGDSADRLLSRLRTLNL